MALVVLVWVRELVQERRSEGEGDRERGREGREKTNSNLLVEHALRRLIPITVLAFFLPF